MTEARTISGSTVPVAGGTGSFGGTMVRRLLSSRVRHPASVEILEGS